MRRPVTQPTTVPVMVFVGNSRLEGSRLISVGAKGFMYEVVAVAGLDEVGVVNPDDKVDLSNEELAERPLEEDALKDELLDNEVVVGEDNDDEEGLGLCISAVKSAPPFAQHGSESPQHQRVILVSKLHGLTCKLVPSSRTTESLHTAKQSRGLAQNSSQKLWLC